MSETQQKLKAMVVDDSPGVRDLLMRFLRAAFPAIAWDFVEAGDGATALRKFDPHSVHIVFLDWEMPRMSGLEFIREARLRGNADHVPIVMVTGRGLVGDIEKCLDAYQVHSYITKPFSVADLKHRLHKVLEELLAAQAEKHPSFFERLLGV